MTDHRENILVGDDVLRVRHADVGLGLVVEGYELDLEALFLEGALEFLDGELRAELDALAERRLTAAERTLRGDLDGALAPCASRFEAGSSATAMMATSARTRYPL